MEKRPAYRIYRSFGEAMETLTDEQVGKLFRAINAYALDGIEPGLEGALKGFFILMKPVLDAEWANYENGGKGGRPKKTKTEPIENPTETEEKPIKNRRETEPKPNENPTETETEPNQKAKKKEERKKKDIKEDASNDASKKSPAAVIALYNTRCPSFPKVKILSESRKRAISARLKTYSMQDFERLFDMAERSAFLKGANNRNWSADFDWLITDTNMPKVLEGKYGDDRGQMANPYGARTRPQVAMELAEIEELEFKNMRKD